MRKIKSILRSFSLSSDFDKALVKLDSSDDYVKPSDDIFTKIQTAFEGQNLDISAQKAKDELLSMLSKCDNWVIGLKLLFIFHKLINSIKLNISIQFAQNDLFEDLQQSLRIINQRDEVFVPIVLKYYTFLRLISKNYSEVYECEQYYQTESNEFVKNRTIQSIIETMNPLVSILKNIVKIEQSLQYALQNFQKYDILKEVTLLILKQTVIIFDYLSFLMSQIRDKILTEDVKTSLQIYDLYEQVITHNKNIEKMYGLRYLTNDSLIKKPHYFVVEKEINKKIELYVNSIHKKLDNTDNVTATITKSVNESSLLSFPSTSSTQKNRGYKSMESTELGVIPKQTLRKSKINEYENEEEEKQKDGSNTNTNSNSNINFNNNVIVKIGPKGKKPASQSRISEINFIEFKGSSEGEEEEDVSQLEMENYNDDRIIVVNNLCGVAEKIQPSIRIDNDKFKHFDTSIKPIKTEENELISSSSIIKIGFFDKKQDDDLEEFLQYKM